MFQSLLTTIRVATFLSGALLLDPFLQAAETSKQVTAQVEELNPFTHLAQIPAGARLDSIRLEKIRSVNVPAAIKRDGDATYCGQLAFRDPGGSMFCPSANIDSTVAAYEVTYSYTGSATMADEFGNRYFTFSVYLRPDELAPKFREALSVRHRNRSDVAAHFTLNTYREPVRRMSIDSVQSKFCAGNFVDGSWMHVNPSCQDDVRYTMVSSPSDYITVRIDTVSESAPGMAVQRAPHSRDSLTKQ